MVVAIPLVVKAELNILQLPRRDRQRIYKLFKIKLIMYCHPPGGQLPRAPGEAKNRSRWGEYNQLIKNIAFFVDTEAGVRRD
jgi:hypothetical protein